MSIRNGHRWIQKPPRGVTVDITHPLSRGLVAAFLMQESTGPALNDQVGRFTGTFAAGSAAPTWASGPRGPVLNFSAASSQVVDCGTPLAGKTLSAVTIAGWLYKPTSTANMASFGWGDTSGFRLDLLWFSDGNLYCQVENGGASSPSASLTAGWHHLATVFSSGVQKLYVDGVARTLSAATPPSTYAVTGHFRIGEELSNTRFTTGQIDDVRIWNRALTASEVSSLYADPYAIMLAPAARRAMSIGDPTLGTRQVMLSWGGNARVVVY